MRDSMRNDVDAAVSADELSAQCDDASHTAAETIALELAYHGAPYAGFARQEGQRTVQGDLEQALSLLFKRPVETTCAGRTDAGVHALGQVVSFDVSPADMEGRKDHTLIRSLNALTLEQTQVRSLSHKPLGFSARFDAKAREYHYHLAVGPTPPIFMRDFSWHVGPTIDVAAMEEASKLLIGEKDFKSFCTAASAVGKPTCRTVHEISFSHEEIMGEPFVVIKVVGNAFLHSMVRTLTGTLMAVGRGKREPSWVEEVLEARDRTCAGETAPARGLVFWRVLY